MYISHVIKSNAADGDILPCIKLISSSQCLHPACSGGAQWLYHKSNSMMGEGNVPLFSKPHLHNLPDSVDMLNMDAVHIC